MDLTNKWDSNSYTKIYEAKKSIYTVLIKLHHNNLALVMLYNPYESKCNATSPSAKSKE